MAYLQSMRGDYRMARYRGDPGIFGSLWRAGKGAVTGFLSGGPVGAVRGGVYGLVGGGGGTTSTYPSRPGGLPVLPTNGSTKEPASKGIFGFGKEKKKRRRMNVANARALRRAIRRQTGFVKLARRALHGTGYTIVSRSSRARKVASVRETGPGSVIVR